MSSAWEPLFAAQRSRLLRVAYATLGSLSEAEDVVQEAWLRAQRVSLATVANPEAWLTTVVGRLALDALRSARVRRERYIGPWLPEPIVELDAAEDAARAEQVSMALLVVLERLSPAERSAFVLHDVFGMSFADVAATLSRGEPAVRQLASRARRRVRAEQPRFTPSRSEQRAVISAFAQAAAEGDLQALIAVLEPDVVLRADGGGNVSAARRPLRGAQRVARALVALARKDGATRRGALVFVNDGLGLLLEQRGERTVMAFTIGAGRVIALDLIRNPEKLRAVPPLPGAP